MPHPIDATLKDIYREDRPAPCSGSAQWRGGNGEAVQFMGTLRFGSAGAANEAALRALADFDRLERLADLLLTAASWTDFLATP